MLLPAFQSMYCYGGTFLEAGNKSCLSEACQNPSMAALTERQQSPLTTGGAVIGPTLTAGAINGKQCLGPTITGHGHSSLQVNHGCEFSSARAGYCQNTFRNY